MNSKKRSTRTKGKLALFATTTFGIIRLAIPLPLPRTSATPNRALRFSTPPEPAVTYFNYYKTGYYASNYPEPKRTDLNALEEEILNDEILKEEP